MQARFSSSYTLDLKAQLYLNPKANAETQTPSPGHKRSSERRDPATLSFWRVSCGFVYGLWGLGLTLTGGMPLRYSQFPGLPSHTVSKALGQLSKPTSSSALVQCMSFSKRTKASRQGTLRARQRRGLRRLRLGGYYFGVEGFVGLGFWA